MCPVGMWIVWLSIVDGMGMLLFFCLAKWQVLLNWYYHTDDRSMFIGPYFLLQNPATDASFLACCYPLVMRLAKKEKPIMKWAMLLIPPTAIIATRSSTGMALLAIGIALTLSFRWAIALLVAAPLSMWAYLGTYELLNQNGRTHAWKIGMDYFFEAANQWVGFTGGTFYIIGTQLQIKELRGLAGHGEIFPNMHNDWLQLIFETGYIGFSLFVIGTGVALWQLRKTRYLKASFVCLCLMGLTQMPLRFFLTSLFGVFLLTQASRTDCKTQDQ